ncbi:hypothetical protein BDV96DRAFT_58930 [Lophiotrema nucula]|uniref:Uncharacterized protein n=1 Tax=Lophiotrema nucula TaxID=690887 RepID=A0A6A5Z8V2_9PLEO|nr:hypothetical protein BDV96DRAFT_58930 [Lophiotrema nucula]
MNNNISSDKIRSMANQRFSWAPGDEQQPLEVAPRRQQMLIDNETSQQIGYQWNDDTSSSSSFDMKGPFQPAAWFCKQPAHTRSNNQSLGRYERTGYSDQNATSNTSLKHGVATNVSVSYEGHEEVNRYEQIGLAYGDNEIAAGHFQAGTPCYSLHTPVSTENLCDIFIHNGRSYGDVVPRQQAHRKFDPQTRSSRVQPNERPWIQFYTQGVSPPLPTSLVAGIALIQEQRGKDIQDLQLHVQPRRKSQTDDTTQGANSRCYTGTEAESLTGVAALDIGTSIPEHNIHFLSSQSRPELHIETPT